MKKTNYYLNKDHLILNNQSNHEYNRILNISNLNEIKNIFSFHKEDNIKEQPSKNDNNKNYYIS